MSTSDDARQVAALDVAYKAAVEGNDAETMDGILADDFVLITGKGRAHTKDDLPEEARSGRVQHQRAWDRTVRVWGDTAVVTARLSAKGTEEGEPFQYRVWCSDTYARLGDGWRYVVGQASARLEPTV